LVQKHFRPTTSRFLAALTRALPELPQEELAWRVHFMVGAMAHTLCGAPMFAGISLSGDFHRRMQRLVAFLTAGFHAPVPGDSSSSRDEEK
jgi:hypothetical protein